MVQPRSGPTQPSVENWLTALADAELEYRRERVKVGAVLLTGWVLYAPAPKQRIKKGTNRDNRQVQEAEEVKEPKSRQTGPASNGDTLRWTGFLESEKTQNGSDQGASLLPDPHGCVPETGEMAAGQIRRSLAGHRYKKEAHAYCLSKAIKLQMTCCPTTPDTPDAPADLASPV